MYEYRIEEVRGQRDAEVMINKYVKAGWRVVSNSVLYSWGYVFFITFEKQIKE